MTVISDLITDAFRENNLIAAGTTPTTAEAAEGLTVLNRFIDGLYGYELGENLAPWQVPGILRTAPVDANYPQQPYPHDLPDCVWPYPPENQRIIVGTIAPTTIYFPAEPHDGARMALTSTAYATAPGVLTVDSNGRGFLATGGALTETLVLTPPLTPQSWFYRADLAQWVQMGDKLSTDISMFPAEFDNLVICATSYRLCPRFGVEPRPGTTTEMAQQIKRLKARYRQQAVTVYGSQDFPRSLQSYIAGRWWF